MKKVRIEISQIRDLLGETAREYQALARLIAQCDERTRTVTSDEVLSAALECNRSGSRQGARVLLRIYRESTGFPLFFGDELLPLTAREESEAVR